MVKRLIGIALAAFMLIAMLAACAPTPPAPPAPAPAPPQGETPAAPAEGDWKIGIMTGTVAQSEESYLMARILQERFGEDRIIRTTYPDNFVAEMEVMIANVQAMVDAGARAIVITEAVPGTIAAIQSSRELFGEDIFFFAGISHEPPEDIAAHADIAIITDEIGQGRAIIEQAYAMGADTFAHISFPRHMAMETIAVRHSLFQRYAEEKGMRWVELTAPDPATEGVAQTQMFLLENVPRWVEEFGPNTAFFATNCGSQEPTMVQVAAYGGFFPLQCCPGPFHGLPAAFNIDMQGREVDVDFVVEQLQIAIDAAGATGRFSTWPVPMHMLVIETGVLYSIEFLEGRTNGRHDPEVLLRIINQVAAIYTPDALVELSNWELDDGRIVENFYLVLQNFINF